MDHAVYIYFEENIFPSDLDLNWPRPPYTADDYNRTYYGMANQTPGSKCDTGSKYELGVTALFASLLSKNKNVEDYRIFSNLADAQPFDDIVAEVRFKELERKQIYAIQVKSGKDKLNINKYCNGYDKIVREGGLKLLDNVGNYRISFWYFCSKGPAKKTFPLVRDTDTFDLNLQPRCRPHNLHETVFDKAVSYGLFPENSNMTDHQDFFANFYLFFHQPDTDKIIYTIKGMWSIDKPWSILQYLDNYLAKNSDGLDKATFEHELLKIRLSDYVVTPTAAIAFQHEAVEKWNRLTLQKDVTIVRNETDVERYIFGCILQNISNVISNEEWNHAVDNLGKLDHHLKTRLKATSFKADTLRELMFQTWVDRKTPLLLKTDTSLPILEEFSHLNKCYVVIDSNVDRRYKEINGYKLRGFRHLDDVEANELTNVVPVSLQGRKPASLSEIINEDEQLKQVVTCLDVINFIKPRETYLKLECLESNNYMLLLVETAEHEQYKNDEHQPTGSNIAIYCGLDESESNYTKYRPEPRYRNYKILRIRMTDDGKLKLIRRLREPYEEEYRGLECFFVDQDGESVYYMADGSVVPVIGEVPTRTDTHFRWKYVPRYLREEIKKDEARPSDEGACKIRKVYSNQKLAEKDFFKKCSKKVNVITGEPGMGKTTLLHSLFAFCESKYYVLFVDLARIRGDLLSGKLKSCRHLLNLSRDKYRSLSYNCLLDGLHDRPDRLVLILDSFDEIAATCKQQVLELVRSIEDVGLQNVIIASRLTSLDLLVDNLDVKIFKMEGLNEQSKLYNDIWNLDIKKLRLIPTEFLATPLYLNILRALSENGMNLEVVNRWNLYESVLKLKMEDYSRRNYPDEHEKQFILGKHGELALKVIFGTNEVTKKRDHRMQSINSNFIRLGFITYFDNENPGFVHRTFAEFFVVKWLIQNVGHDDAAYIYQLILDDGSENILNMYSESLPLHKAILREDIDEVRRLYREDKKCLLETDGFGRNALHLAVIPPEYIFYSKILDFLLPRMRNEGCDIHARDNIRKWKWIDYYERRNFAHYLNESFSIKEAYLGYYASHIDELDYCQYSLDDDFNEFYHDAVRHSSISLVRDLLFLKYHKNKAFLEFRRACSSSHKANVSRINLPKEKLKGVHLACIYGNIEVVKAYIESGADFTKTDKFKCTPLHYSVMAEQGNEVVKLLLDTHGISNLYIGQRNENTILDMSVRRGDVNVTKMILERIDGQTIDALLNTACTRYHTPLELAIEYENNGMVELLLQHGANPNRAETYLLSPFVQAVESRNEDIVEMLLNYGADVNAPGGILTPLCRAIRTAQTAMMELLLQKGAHVNNVDEYGWTPLTLAISWDANKEVVQVLVNNGADVNLRNKNGDIPIFMAINRGHLRIMELLLINKLRLDCLNSNGWTPLILAIREGRKDMVRMLLDGIHYKGELGITPLCAAIEKKNADIVDILLDHQADVNSVDDYGISPLITAVEVDSLQIAGMLLRKGANVNFKNDYGITALYAAAFKRNVPMVELLLEHGADANFITFYEEIFCKAKDAKKIEIALRLLKNCNIRHRSSASTSSAAIVIERVAENWTNIDLMNELRIVAGEQHVSSNTIKILMEWGGKIDVECEFWKTIFCLINEMNNENVDNVFFHNSTIKRQFNRICNAASNVNLDIIRILSRHRETRFEFFQTAIELGNEDIVQAILQNAGARNLRNNHTTALHIALHQRNTDIAKMLLEHGCEADPINFAGVTPLLVAVSTDNTAIVEILLSKGADINFQEEDSGISALFIAALKENRPMVRKLLQDGANKNVDVSRDSLLFVIEHHLTWWDIDLCTCDTSEIIRKVKRIIEEESTDTELKKNVNVRRTLLGKILRF